jgi:hypothetical protein
VTPGLSSTTEGCDREEAGIEMRHTHMGFTHGRSPRTAAWACMLVAAWLVAAPAPASAHDRRVGPYHAARDVASAPARADAIHARAVQPPQNDTPPDFEGFLVVGETLTAVPGDWSDSPTSYAYQWYSCDPDFNDCPDIAGATQPTYTLTGAELGRYVGIQVIATNDAGDSNPAVSGPFGPIVQAYPALVTAPVITGTAREDQTLSATPGTWTGSPTSFSYQWYRCDVALANCRGIAGAAGPFYPVAAADVGSRLIVTVIASNATGDSLEGSSQPTATVVGLPPGNVVAPAIQGTAQEGATILVNPGTWSRGPVGYAYQWLRCNAAGAACVGIPGDTDIRHQVVAADVGSRLTAVVRAANGSGLSAPAAASPTAVVLMALNISVNRVSTKARSDGSIAMTLRTKNPGALTATATAPSGSLAAKLCVRHCPKSHQLAYGKGSATLAKPGLVVLVVKPNARARRAVAKYRRIVVRVSLTFKSSIGAGTNTKVSLVTVKKARPKHAR